MVSSRRTGLHRPDWYGLVLTYVFQPEGQRGDFHRTAAETVRFRRIV